MIFPINALNSVAQDWQVMRVVRQMLVTSADQVPACLELALQRYLLETKQAVLPVRAPLSEAGS